MSRIETGFKKAVSAEELETLLDYYGEDDQEIRAGLHECARQAKQRGWWMRYRTVLSSALPDFEAEASRIRTYECQVIPGLLQTPDYATAIFRANRVRSDEEIAERVAARIKRQDILNRVNPPRYWVIIDEAALRRTVGSHEVMTIQLTHLTHMAARHNIDIQVLPFSEGAHAATTGSFVIMDFPDPRDTSIAYMDTPTSSLYLEESDDLDEFEAMFGGAQGAALSPDKSLRFIDDAIKALEE
ncbi:helix-turn-helix transcriptional regulator [Nocardiopsis gilva]